MLAGLVVGYMNTLDRFKWLFAFLYWIFAYIILRIMCGPLVPFKTKVKLLTIRKIIWFHKEIVVSNAEIVNLEMAEIRMHQFPFGVTYKEKLLKSLGLQRNKNAHLRSELFKTIKLIKESNKDERNSHRTNCE